MTFPPYQQQPVPPYQQPMQPYPQQMYPGQPYAPPAIEEQSKPVEWEGDPSEIFSTRRPSISWGTVRQPVPFGTRRLLAVYESPVVKQGMDYSTKKLATWPDGNPKFQVIIGVIDEAGEENGYYMGRPSAAMAAMKDAIDRTGIDVEPGVLIDVTYTHDQQGMDKDKEPAKQFAINLYSFEDGKAYMTAAQRAVVERKLAAKSEVPPAPPAPPPVGGLGAPGTQPVAPQGVPLMPGPIPVAPQWVSPQVAAQQAPAQPPPPTPVAPQQVPGMFGGYSVEQLGMLRAFSPEQMTMLGHDPAKVAAAVAEGVATGQLPPF